MARVQAMWLKCLGFDSHPVPPNTLLYFLNPSPSFRLWKKTTLLMSLNGNMLQYSSWGCWKINYGKSLKQRSRPHNIQWKLIVNLKIKSEKMKPENQMWVNDCNRLTQGTKLSTVWPGAELGLDTGQPSFYGDQYPQLKKGASFSRDWPN